MNTHSTYDSVAYDPMKTRLSEDTHNTPFRALWLVGSFAFASNSDNLIVTGSKATVENGIGTNRNHSDSLDSDSDKLTTTPMSVDRTFANNLTELEAHDQVLVESRSYTFIYHLFSKTKFLHNIKDSTSLTIGGT